jgi:hypothetical protein
VPFSAGDRERLFRDSLEESNEYVSCFDTKRKMLISNGRIGQSPVSRLRFEGFMLQNIEKFFFELELDFIPACNTRRKSLILDAKYLMGV